MAALRSEDQFLCSICLDLFTEPVSTPCGHNFCRQCLSHAWDTSPCRCPLCKELFHRKPLLRVNTLLSGMVFLRKQEARSRSEVSKPGEVSCDYCSAPKLKALKSCLVCLSSYCESHLQPHLSVPRLKSHQLMDPLANMENRMCPQHHKPLELFCRSDHSLLCTMCALMEHQAHRFVPLKEEVDQRKPSLQQMQQQSRQMIDQRSQKIQELLGSVQLSKSAADREMSTGLQAFSALIESVQRTRDSFIQELQDKQRQIQAEAQALLKQLKKEIWELEQRSTEAAILLRSEDHLRFLQCCPALPPTGLADCSTVRMEPQMFEGSTSRALSELEQSLKETFLEMKKMPRSQLQRVQQFSVDLTLDTNSAHAKLSVSKDLKQVHHTYDRKFTENPQRFSSLNILAKQSYSSGKFYFEVQVKDKTFWVLGVAKKSVDRKQTQDLNSTHGYWCLRLQSTNKYFACTDPNLPLPLKCAPLKVGVFVDYDEGLVSFYNVDTADLIYSFTGCSFRERLVPFLNPCDCLFEENISPLILTAVEK